LSATGCQGQVANSPPIEGDPDGPDGGLGLVPLSDDGVDAGVANPMLGAGMKARVIASELNLRDAAGTSANILAQMPCGAEVDIIGGPSTNPVDWWNLNYQTMTGWASGKYLVPEASFDASVCTGGASDGGTTNPSPSPASDGGVTADSIFALAKSAVGYSYYWGHGSWRADGTNIGTCTGTCPSCSHTGQYGADCSGFVAKVWQVPAASPITTDAHPYSTYNFYYETEHWKPVPRANIQPADAFVYRNGSEGHIALYDTGTDPFGNVWLYEARGCATGIVHDLRTPDSTYITIRRDGL
jgi:cell wall-associated NlpC family hydrolase